MPRLEKIVLVAAALTALSACDWAPKQKENNRYLGGENYLPEKEGGTGAVASMDAPTPEACVAAEQAMDQMVGLSRGGLVYKDGGEVVIDAAAWAQIPASYRMNLAQVAAHVAACPAGSAQEQVITFRSKQDNSVLAQGKYSEFGSLGGGGTAKSK